MPAIFDLIYREYCRARLAEMRKQLLLRGKHPERLPPDYGRADQGNLGRTDTPQEISAREPN
ncbi:hypothetical protein [Bradyrhizobium sp. MOS002]|uniref:hypothetical protein n=1 Tax=Bradyrhizobium sp. MOS002 TaxID=2133947 RepID=UPI000D124823|nr:hypothetical protein [Bradyrhizobium sp. MOS002]PSO25983.1 hypothetical protein C7G41_28825 [Bradyrhizobium sp. MOS002]